MSASAAIGRAAVLLVFLTVGAQARDDGRYAQSPLHDWFNGLHSNRGPCCSFADGKSISDVDWEAKGDAYRVRIGDEWINVPADAIVRTPNRLGPAVVWPYKDEHGHTQIRCFMAGAMG